jgi:hypothetical protein
MITANMRETIDTFGSVVVRRASRRVVRFLHLLVFRFLQDGGLHHTASLTYTACCRWCR